MANVAPAQFDIKLEDIGFKNESQYKKSTERTILGRINKFIDTRKINRGDVIYITGITGYRNQGKYIWNGEKATSLDYDSFEYGALPYIYEISDTNSFEPKSWLNLIDYYSFVWFSPEIINRLKFVKGTKYQLESTITIKGHKWTFVCEDSIDKLTKALATNKRTFSVINDKEIMVQITEYAYGKPGAKNANAEKPENKEDKSAKCLKVEREIEETRARLAQLEATRAELCKK